MRFLADENVSGLIIKRLRDLGFDVFSIAQDSSGITDQEVLKIADEDNLILITEDRDFGELVIRQRLHICGVILIELDRLSTSGEADRVGKCVAGNREQLTGNLVVIEPGRIRIRPLLPPENNN